MADQKNAMLVLVWQYAMKSVTGYPTNHHEEVTDACKSSDVCTVLSQKHYSCISSDER